MNVAILGSGKGSNAEAILSTALDGRLGSARVVGLISDNEEARILRLGPQYNVPSVFIHPGEFKTKLSTEAEGEYIKQLKDWNTDLVVLAGFMRIIKDPFLDAFRGSVINLHPSLLPKYPGLNSVKRALEAKDSEAGCTVHWVNSEIDGGEIIRQSVVRIEDHDTLETLEAKVHVAEHLLLPSVIREISMTENTPKKLLK